MKQKNVKFNFIIYTIILAAIWGLLAVLITRIFVDDTILSDFLQAFTFVIISGILTYVMFYYFRGFYKKGKLK